MKEYLEIFLTFIKMGCVTFGGGYAMIPVVERELIKKKGWVTMDEVMDYYTIAQITPGIIAVNLSTFVGYKQKGPLGGVMATIGIILPGVSAAALIALFIRNFVHIPAVQHAFTGIRIAVGALILDTVIKMVKGIFTDIKALVLYAAAFALSAVWGISPVLIILGAGLIGLAVYRNRKGRG
ncbi:MAG: chromate transporter [Treponema sp.]|nr:chromate transporter [Treponema sp.]